VEQLLHIGMGPGDHVGSDQLTSPLGCGDAGIDR
jgi:hypothetical protein